MSLSTVILEIVCVAMAATIYIGIDNERMARKQRKEKAREHDR